MDPPFKEYISNVLVALLTGGGTGIGYKIAAEMGKHGAPFAMMGHRINVFGSAIFALHHFAAKAAVDSLAQSLALGDTTGVTKLLPRTFVPGNMSKAAIKQLSKALEKRSRDAPVGVPKNKL
ncbi:hypothetical protein Tco_0658419 [Tanacetum coccineum]